MSILRELYKKFAENGYFVLKNAEYVSMNEKIKEVREYLMGRLSPEDGEQLIKLETLYTGTSNIDEAELFCKGFKVAILLIAEVYT